MPLKVIEFQIFVDRIRLLPIPHHQVIPFVWLIRRSDTTKPTSNGHDDKSLFKNYAEGDYNFNFRIPGMIILTFEVGLYLFIGYRVRDFSRSWDKKMEEYSRINCIGISFLSILLVNYIIITSAWKILLF